jgi:proteasome assembly chaperone (PAC2) family protein
MPRNLLYQTDATGDGPRLTVFIGESQPNSGSYSFAQELMNKAAELGVDRVVTFASMASQLHPSAQPRVFGAATHENLVDELRRLEVQPLKEGQIGGLNGVLLGAAAEHNVPGLCLMGEIPFFAAGVPNPKAAKAVISALTHLTGLEVDPDGLDPHIEAIDRVLTQMLERMQSDQHPSDESGHDALTGDEPEADAELDRAAASRSNGPKLDLATRERIETLFSEARNDRTRAVALKQELDRLHIFPQYEDRFLDLFRRAE